LEAINIMAELEIGLPINIDQKPYQINEIIKLIKEKLLKDEEQYLKKEQRKLKAFRERKRLWR